MKRVSKVTSPPERRSGRRPTAKRGSREQILDAAERLFADHGYTACSIRMISDKSGINQGLVHYHFGSKKQLFTEVFLRRGQIIAQERMAFLDEAEAQARGKRVPLERVVRCFIEPPLKLAQQGPSGRAFVRIQARLNNEPRELALELRSRVYDESTFRYVDAVRRALPHLPAETVYWRFTFMIGTYLIMLSQNGRLEAISRGKCSSTDMNAAVRQMVPFLVGGFSASPTARRGTAFALGESAVLA